MGVSPDSSREKKKRFVEMVVAIIVIFLLWVMARLEARLFEIAEFLSQYKDFVNTLSYFALININVILILFLSFLLFRNVVRLVIERKRGVIGSKLKTKLVVALVFFALVPTVIVYTSTQYITKRFVGWFSDQVTETIKLTREAGEDVYNQDQKRVKSLARIALQNIELIQPDGVFFKGHPRVKVVNLDNFSEEYGVHSVEIFRPGGQLLWSSDRDYRHQAPYAFDKFAEEVTTQFLENNDLLAIGSVIGKAGQDVVKGAAPLFDPIYGNLVGIAIVEERFESQLLVKLGNVLGDFARLKPEAQLIRLNYMVIMIVLMLLIVFSAIWLGFYVARAITGPLQALSEATREVALGNYNVALKSTTDDETGQLVRAFNVMTRDLEKHERETRDAKASLEKSNFELQEKSQYLEIVLKSISAGVISLDEDGKISEVNKAAENLLLTEYSAAKGLLPKKIFSAEFYDLFWKPIEARIATGRLYQGYVDLSELGRDVVLIVRATQIKNYDGKTIGGVVVFDDAQDQVRAQRAAAWKEVAKRIAHEIKNPITPIKLNAQRIQRKYQSRFKGEDAQIFNTCLAAILGQVDQLRDLVNEFAVFSKLPQANLKAGSLNNLIRDVFSFYCAGYSNISWVLKLDEKAPDIFFDKEQIRRVFVNLLANAIEAIEQDSMKSSEATNKFSGYTGEVIVATRYFADLKSIRVEVRDTGPGIANSLKSKILEPYVSTKGEGTGLGLAIVSQIVSDHGGYLQVLDNTPRGAIIAFELPVRREGIKNGKVFK